jgi:MOSC domain-containing protein YiiM
MMPHGAVSIDANTGVFGNRPGKGGQTGKRAVTILSKELWNETCTDLGVVLPWTTRRASVLISGMDFTAISDGLRLQFGPAVILEVTGITQPCKRMDEAHQGLKAALHGVRGGFTCRVILAGDIRLGDNVTIFP